MTPWCAGLALCGIVAAGGCATQTFWLNGHPQILEEHHDVVVRLYRAGPHCRLEIINKTETIITRPTRCLIVPHRQQP